MDDLYEASKKGNLEKVTELINNGADVNKMTTKGFFSLYIASQEGHTDVVEKLLESGADVNKMTTNGIFSLYIASQEGHTDVVKKLLESGADVNKTTTHGFFSLYVASQKGHTDVVKKLLASGADVNKMTTTGFFSLYIASHEGHTNVVEKLLASGADVNKMTTNGNSSLLVASQEGYTNVVEKLLASGADVNMKYKGKSMIIYAEENTFKPEINELILAKASVSDNDSKKWKGLTQSDIANLDTIFDITAEPGKRPPAENWSMCPICLKYSERSTGCKYMHHNCKLEGGYYHKNLYNTYKTPEGMIWWCTICGRICNGHRHYELSPWTTKPPLHAPGGDPFSSDCRGAEGGGGLEEKLGRFRRFREIARKLQDEIDEISYKEAMNELVQETWNGPFVEQRRTKKVGETKKWNISTSNFRPNIRPINYVGNVRNYPNVTRSNTNVATLRPTTIIEHNDLENRDTTMIQFHHRQADGSINHHEGNLISKEQFEEFINNQNHSFGTESFGMCWDYPRCTARLYPDEIKDFVPAESYATYKKHFNKKFAAIGAAAAAQGGRRRTRKNKRLQKGGEQQNVIVEAKLASCSLPQRAGKIRTMKRKTQKRKTQKRKFHKRNTCKVNRSRKA